MSTKKELVNYIKKNLNNGYSRDQIEKVLRDAGWSDSNIKDAFELALSNEKFDKESSEEFIEESFNNAGRNNDNINNDISSVNGKETSSKNNKPLIIAALSFFIIFSLGFGFYLATREDLEKEEVSKVDEEILDEEQEKEDIDDSEVADEDEADEIQKEEVEEVEEDFSLEDADQCQPGEFEVAFTLQEGQESLPLEGKMAFHGLEDDYCMISYSLDFSENIDLPFDFDPHFTGEQNFCFLQKDNFDEFHKEIQKEVTSSQYVWNCFFESLQSEKEANEFRKVIKNHYDGNYFSDFEWTVTSIFPLEVTSVERIEFMGSSDKNKCFFKGETISSSLDYDEMDFVDQGPPPRYCVVSCDEAINKILGNRNSFELSFRTLSKPEGLDYSEMIEKDDHVFVLQYITTLTNGIPCVHATDELIEKDPNIESASDIFEALLGHDDL